MTRTDKLLNLMKERNLTAQQVADLLEVRVNTVEVWRCKNETMIPQSKLSLLDILTRNAV